MDKLTLLGLLLGGIAILGGQKLEGGSLSSLVNGPALVIVLGGTLGAVLLQTPFLIFKQSLKMLSWILIPPKLSIIEGVKRIINWSMISRKEGLLGLEKISNVKDTFERKALDLLIDGNDTKSIRHSLVMEIEAKERFLMKSAKVYEAMGGYSPTIGILGAVLGLIQVMQNLSDPSRLGSGIATAFVATIYGVGFANLLFLPIANKLKLLVMAMSEYREMFAEGVIAIGEGENPRVIEDKLSGFLHQ
ncbi:MAG: flagellar motor protein [Pseudomonadota bacterium]